MDQDIFTRLDSMVKELRSMYEIADKLRQRIHDAESELERIQQYELDRQSDYHVLQYVKIKDNAFAGSDNPNDANWRGKVVRLTHHYGSGAWEAASGNDVVPLTEDEIEALEA